MKRPTCETCVYLHNEDAKVKTATSVRFGSGPRKVMGDEHPHKNIGCRIGLTARAENYGKSKKQFDR